MSKEKPIEEMAKCCTYYHNGECCADITHICDCDLMCEMFGVFANIDLAGYRKQEWISVEERLPEKNISVLAFYHRVYKSGGSFDVALVAKLDEEGFFVPFNCSPVRDKSITHWMPLPEAPKGGNDK